MKKLQLIFNEKYSTIHRIGLSNFSEVYLALNPSTQEEFAIKIEPIVANNCIEREAKFYRILKGGVGIPNLHWYGVDNQYRALVTDVLGPSLEQLLHFCGGKFSLKTVLLILDQVLDRLQWIHSKNIVYGDVDTGNFLVGLRQKADKIFIVDFGSCRKYTDENDQHLALGEQNRKFLSNYRFKSIYSHIGKLQSRRDDLESLGYLMVYMLKGQLPWDNFEVGEEIMDRQLLVKEKKESIPVEILCEDFPAEFPKYFKYIQSLEFEEEPDYTWIKRLFKDLFERSGYQNNRVFDWAQKHQY